MTRYVRSSHLEIESSEGDSVVVLHSRLGHRLLLSRATHDFLELFKQPLSLDDLARLGPLDQAMPAFKRLRHARYLVEEGHQETASDRLLSRIERGLFGCPAASADRPAAVTFLGAPFDAGNTISPGARFGPPALRRVSQTHFGIYAIEPGTGRARGWYDNDRRVKLLDGVALADAGDVFHAPGEAPGTFFGKLQEVVAEILESGALPVVLGGDHSITYPALAAFAAPLEIVQIDAHTDRAEYYAGEQHHHGNFMSRALALPHVAGVHQVGVRGTTVAPQAHAGGKVRTALTPRQLRRTGTARFVAALPAAGAYYVTFDVDALDPSYAPGTSTPVPDGLTFAEAKRLLIALAGTRRCVGFDLVEVNPQQDPRDLTAIVVLELLLAFLGAHFGRVAGAVTAAARQAGEP